MGLAKIIAWLSEWENQKGNYYLWLSKIFASDSEASSLFSQLNNAKNLCSLNVNSVLKLLIKSGKNFKEIELDPGLMTELLTKIDNFKNLYPEPSLQQALNFAIKIESEPALLELSKKILASQPGLKPLINTLVSSWGEHYALLKKFASSRGICSQTHKSTPQTILPLNPPSQSLT